MRSDSSSERDNNTVYASAYCGIEIGSSSEADVRNNILYLNGSALCDSGSGTAASYNFVDDPLFVDAPNAFRLKQGRRR